MGSIRKNIYCICMLLIVFILSGCGTKNEEIEQREVQPVKIQNPVTGGKLQLPITKFDTLNPIVNDNRSVYYLQKLIYDGLVRLDEHFEAQPGLAKAWSSSVDGTEWTFQLRDNVKWHDAKPFTADDVKFTIDTIKYAMGSKDESIYAVSLQHITDIITVGSDKIIIKFDSPLNNGIEVFTFPIIPKHRFNSIPEVYKTIEISPIGTGAYRVEAYDKLKAVELVVSDVYWGDMPYISSILAKIVPDKDAALSSLEANEVSVAEAQNFQWEKYSEDKSLKIYEYITNEYEFLGYNFNRKITNDKNIRKAIAYSIDRHAIVDEVYFGHATVTDVPLDPASWLYDEEEKRFGMDVEGAKRLLLKSKYEDRDGDGLVEDEFGQSLELSLLVNEDNPLRVKVADTIASDLKRIGILVNVNPVNWEEYQNRIFSNNFDILLSGWHLGNPSDLAFMLYSNNIGGTNFIGYSNDEMDQLLMEASTTSSKELKKEKYKQIQHLFVEDVPYYSLYFKNNALIAKKYIEGNVNPKPYDIYSNIGKWHILEE